jgi:sec-independent protein translocase protein TatC
MEETIFPFKFYLHKEVAKTKNLMAELFFDEHIEEIRQRLFQSCFFIFCILLLSFVNIKAIVQLLEVPVTSVKFFQSSPGEYFVSTLKISLYTSLVFCIPGLLSQLLFFLLPGLTSREKKMTLGLLVSSCFLLFLGFLFSYYVLIPAALNFLIGYSLDVLEPLWSFDEYFSFVLVLFLSTGLVFQIPVIQVTLSFLRLMTGQKMLSLWKQVLLSSTILGAILTPSADPLTQVLLSVAVFLLYVVGSFFAIFFSKSLPVEG